MLSSIPGKVKDPGDGDGSVPGNCSVPIPINNRGKRSGDPLQVEGPVLGQGKDPSTIGAFCPSDTGGNLEYPILNRFRRRRLLSLLEKYSIHAFETMSSHLGVFLNMFYLRRLLVDRQWNDAQDYLSNMDLGDKGVVLVDLLRIIKLMDLIAHEPAGKPCRFTTIQRRSQCFATLGTRNDACIVLTVMSMRYEQLRPTLDWNLVGKKVAEIILDFLYQDPEFNHLFQLPHITSGLHDVVNVFPKGFGSRQVHHVKKAGQIPGSVIIAKHLHLKKKVQKLPQGTRLLADPSAWMRSSIDEALKAGKRTMLHQEHHVKYACNEGMDGKKLWSDGSQDFDAGNYSKRPRLAGQSQGTSPSELLTDSPVWLRASIDEALKADKPTTSHHRNHIYYEYNSMKEMVEKYLAR